MIKDFEAIAFCCFSRDRYSGFTSADLILDTGNKTLFNQDAS
ncbi:hypothetical protein [Pleurocapsa sp. PCC 7319]|nr:hypothetical protein [Pleurocapsa sp. PCC 7319]